MGADTGIYEILNTANGKRYIGQAVNISRRLQGHRADLRHGHSAHRHLQFAWDKYGEAAFEFRVLGLCAPEHLTFFEQQWMDARKPEYNVAPAAGSQLGIKLGPPTAEHRKKNGDARRGRPLGPFTAEHRENLSKSATGRAKNTSFGKPWSPARRAAHDARWPEPPKQDRTYR